MDTIQNFKNYTREDHETWEILFKRQRKIVLEKAAIEFKNGFELLSLDSKKIPSLDEINTKLSPATGWKLIPVTGLVPSDEFFKMLLMNRFPITTSIRRREELNFSKLPDIFHDIYGHVPMLYNKVFSEFMKEYANSSIKNNDNELSLAFYERFYWFTLEMGIIFEDNSYRPYGGAILTSSMEITNIENESMPKYPFDLLRVINTSYNNFDLQKEYFVITSFEELFDGLSQLEKVIQEGIHHNS